MNLFTKRFGLVLAGVVGVGAVASLAMGASFALFSSNVTGAANTFSAGTVTLAANSDASTTCNVGPMSPGDSSTGYPLGIGNNTDPTCVAAVNYTGNLGAYIGVGFTITSTGPNGSALINTGGFGSLFSAQLSLFTSTGSVLHPLTDFNVTMSCNTVAAVQTCTGASAVPLYIGSYPANTTFTSKLDY